MVEKNEPVRSYASFFDVKSQVMKDHNPKLHKFFSKKKIVSFFDVKSLITEEDDFLELE